MYHPLVKNFNRKFGNNRWLASSIKMQREVYLFSDLEYENWIHVETTPEIVKFCEQPCEIKVPFKNKIKSSIPDMWIKYKNVMKHLLK
jgi:hypothetical protein